MLHNRVQTPEPIDIHCHATQPARAVDYRIYLPRLMEDFAERGGRLQVHPIDAKDIDGIAERFDLVVVATPASGFQHLFARDDANSPYDRPQRHYVAGLYHGFRPGHARRATLSVAPGHGEAVCFPFLSRTGMVTALAITTHQPDELATLRVLASRRGRPGFCTTLLRELEQLHPSIYGQIETLRFDLQGANVGSYSAFALADAIAEANVFGLAFCNEVERSRSARILGAAQWTNAFLQPPDEARMELMVAMSHDRQLAAEYYDNFNRPERQWQRVGSAEGIWRCLAESRARTRELARA